jgi:hypothetical protein
MNDSEPPPSGLVVIARDATGQSVTRMTSHRDLVGAMHTGRCVLTLKFDAVRIARASCRKFYFGLPGSAPGHHQPRRRACGADPVTGRPVPLPSIFSALRFQVTNQKPKKGPHFSSS